MPFAYVGCPVPAKWIWLLPFAFFSAAYSLEIQPPNNWLKQERVPAGIFLQFISQERSSGFTPNMNISIKDLGDRADSLRTPIQLNEQMERIQARTFPLYKVTLREVRIVGSANGVLFVSQYAYGALDLAVLQFVFRHQGNMVNVVYTCLLKDLPRFRPEFEKSLSTLKWSDPALPSAPSKAERSTPR